MGTSRRSAATVFVDRMCVPQPLPQNNPKTTPLILIAAGPLPTLEGLADVVGRRSVSPSTRFPPINHDDIRRFTQNFNSAGPIDGFLNSTRF